MAMKTEEFIRQLEQLFANQEYDKAEPFMLTVLEEAKETEDYGLYLSVGNEMIGFYRSVSMFEKAFDIAEDMLLLMEELQMDQSIDFATVLLNAATAYSFAGEFDQALEFYKRAERIYGSLLKPDDYHYTGFYNNMSALLEKMGRDQEALEILQKAIDIIQKYPDHQADIAVNYTNLGLLYLKTAAYEKAETAVEKAIELFQDLEEPVFHYSAALSALGEIYYHKKEYTKSLEYYDKTLAEIDKSYGQNLSYAIICENCAVVCHEAGDSEKEGYYKEKASKIRQTD